MTPILESPDNPKIRHLVKLIEDKKYRNEEKKLVLEGLKLIEEVSHKTKGVLYTTSEVKTLPDWPITLISEKVAKKLSQTEHSEGIFAEVPLPDETNTLTFPLIAFDAVSDPGNMGTLLRTACAFGFKGALFLPGCVDPFNAKVLRSSKGALFKLSYKHINWNELDYYSKMNNLQLLGADLQGKQASEIQGNQFVLILGNEGKGLSEEGKLITEKITLPMQGDMESLNVSVAGGILMYLLSQSK